MNRNITNPKPYLSHPTLWWTSYFLFYFFHFHFWTYKLAVYQRLKGPAWNFSAALLAATARFVFTARFHASVISIYICIKSGLACVAAAKRHHTPAAEDECVHHSWQRKVGQSTHWFVCHWTPPNLPPWASNLSPSTPNVDQSQVGESLPEIKKERKNPPLCSCYNIYYSTRVIYLLASPSWTIFMRTRKDSTVKREENVDIASRQPCVHWATQTHTYTQRCCMNPTRPDHRVCGLSESTTRLPLTRWPARPLAASHIPPHKKRVSFFFFLLRFFVNAWMFQRFSTSRPTAQNLTSFCFFLLTLMPHGG